MKRAHFIPYLVVFGCGFLAAMAWQSLKATSCSRAVQYLDSPNHTHHAILGRRGAFIDLNSEVRLDGRVIYVSPDFSPDRTIPYRETLLWDDTGNRLILEVLGRRLFGYDASQNRRLTDAELPKAKVSPVPASGGVFEGRWPENASTKP